MTELCSPGPALQNRFGTGHQTELNHAKLRARLRRREETLPEDIERLTRLAYPEAEETMVATLAKDQFIDALHDDDMQLKIRQLRPTTVQRALEIALELESYSMASKQKGRAVPEAHVWRQHPGSPLLLRQVTRLSRQFCRNCRSAWKLFSSSSSSRPPGSNRSRGTCWRCRERGHYKRACPQPAAGSTGDAPTPPQGADATSQTMSGNEQ